MKVWHGSYKAIDEVDLAFCEKGKDFGRGFYVTNLLDQAQTWATKMGNKRNVEGVVSEFEYDEYLPGMMKLQTLHFDDYTDEWLDFVVLNRKNSSDTQAHDYDIVEGPVADDRITLQIDDYIAGTLSRKQFLSELVYNPSHQICFCTAQSLQALTLPLQPKARIDSAEYHIGDDVVQALMSEYGLSELEATDLYYTSKTYALVAEESTGYYQKPWREIYEILREELDI